MKKIYSLCASFALLFVFCISVNAKYFDVDKTKWRVVAFDIPSDRQNISEAAKTIDGNINTFWESPWQSPVPPFPHWVVVDMGAEYTVENFTFICRQDAQTANGKVKDYEIYFSNTGTSDADFGTAAVIGTDLYTDNNDRTMKTIAIPSKPTARYFKFVATAPLTPTHAYVTMGEFGVQTEASNPFTPGKKYYVQNIETGRYLCPYFNPDHYHADKLHPENYGQGEVGACPFKFNDSSFEIEFVTVDDANNIYNVKLGDKYLAITGGWRCSLLETPDATCDIKLHNLAVGGASFKMGGALRTDYISPQSTGELAKVNYIFGNSGVTSWKLVEIATAPATLVTPETGKNYFVKNIATGLYLTYPETPVFAQADAAVADKMEDAAADKARQIFTFSKVSGTDYFNMQETFSNKYLTGSSEGQWYSRFVSDISSLDVKFSQLVITSGFEDIRISTLSRYANNESLGYQTYPNGNVAYFDKKDGKSSTWELIEVGKPNSTPSVSAEQTLVYSANNTIYVNATDILGVVVYNMQGQILYSGTNNVIGNIPAGNVIVKLTTKDGVYSYKLAVK